MLPSEYYQRISNHLDEIRNLIHELINTVNTSQQPGEPVPVTVVDGTLTTGSPSVVASEEVFLGPPKATKPTEEQAKAFRDRLRKYQNDILPRAGMLPQEGVGGLADKLKLFVKTMFPNDNVSKSLTVEQWEKFLAFLDQKAVTDGPEALVKHIDEAIRK